MVYDGIKMYINVCTDMYGFVILEKSTCTKCNRTSKWQRLCCHIYI